VKRVKMWVCSACKGIYHTAHAEALGKCPGCGGQGKEQECNKDEAGVIVPVAS